MLTVLSLPPPVHVVWVWTRQVRIAADLQARAVAVPSFGAPNCFNLSVSVDCLPGGSAAGAVGSSALERVNVLRVGCVTNKFAIKPLTASSSQDPVVRHMIGPGESCTVLYRVSDISANDTPSGTGAYGESKGSDDTSGADLGPGGVEGVGEPGVSDQVQPCDDATSLARSPLSRQDSAVDTEAGTAAGVGAGAAGAAGSGAGAGSGEVGFHPHALLPVSSTHVRRDMLRLKHARGVVQRECAAIRWRRFKEAKERAAAARLPPTLRSIRLAAAAAGKETQAAEAAKSPPPPPPTSAESLLANPAVVHVFVLWAIDGEVGEREGEGEGARGRGRGRGRGGGGGRGVETTRPAVVVVTAALARGVLVPTPSRHERPPTAA